MPKIEVSTALFSRVDSNIYPSFTHLNKNTFCSSLRARLIEWTYYQTTLTLFLTRNVMLVLLENKNLIFLTILNEIKLHILLKKNRIFLMTAMYWEGGWGWLGLWCVLLQISGGASVASRLE